MSILHVKPYKEVYVKYRTPRFGGNPGFYAGGGGGGSGGCSSGAIGFSNTPVLFGYVSSEDYALEQPGFLKAFAGLDGFKQYEALFVHLDNIESFSFRLIPEDNSVKEPEKKVKSIFQYSHFDSILADDITKIGVKYLPVETKVTTRCDMVDEIYQAMRNAQLRWQEAD